MIKTFYVSSEELYQHHVGSRDCKQGWCGSGYPAPCKCGGLIHADFGDENYDDYWLYKKCDQCGDEYEEVAESPS